MIETLLMSLLLSFVDPSNPDFNTMYPSGIKDCDKSFFTDKPATKAPILTVANSFYDADKKLVSPGMYEAVFSPENNQILLRQGRFIIAKIPVIQIFPLMEKVSVPSIRIETLDKDKIFVIYRSDYTEVHSVLYNK